MPLAAKPDEAYDVVQVRGFGSSAHVLEAHNLTYLVEGDLLGFASELYRKWLGF